MTTRRRFLSGISATGGLIFGYSALDGGSSAVKTSKDIDVIGHRGASSKVEDNTIKGIKYAAESGADGVEIDVRRTSDGVFILNHDMYVIEDYGAYSLNNTSYDELKEMVHSVTRLTDAIDVVKRYGLELILGMKEPANAEDIWSLVQDKNIVENTKIGMWERHIDDHLVDPDSTIIVGTAPTTTLIETAIEHEINSVMPHYTDNSIEFFINYAHDRDLRAGYWSIVDSHEDLISGLQKEPDFLVTNRPSEAVKLLR